MQLKLNFLLFQPYQAGYTSPPPPPQSEETTIDIGYDHFHYSVSVIHFRFGFMTCNCSDLFVCFLVEDGESRVWI